MHITCYRLLSFRALYVYNSIPQRCTSNLIVVIMISSLLFSVLFCSSPSCFLLFSFLFFCSLLFSPLLSSNPFHFSLISTISSLLFSSILIRTVLISSLPLYFHSFRWRILSCWVRMGSWWLFEKSWCGKTFPGMFRIHKTSRSLQGRYWFSLLWQRIFRRSSCLLDRMGECFYQFHLFIFSSFFLFVIWYYLWCFISHFLLLFVVTFIILFLVSFYLIWIDMILIKENNTILILAYC